MEVHQHAYEHAGDKSWKNYFRKFLVLFLEHKIEKDRERTYINKFL